ncbi:MAG: sugar ABC transporter permease, partial [Cellulosimicrobium funkei]
MLKSLRRAGPALLLLAPSLILVGVFVYGLIGANFRTSITDNHTAAQATGQKPSVVVWFENYTVLLGSEAFQHSLK